MSRMIGTVSRGVRAPIIRSGDDIVEIVTNSVLEAAADGGFEIQDRDIVAMTEAIVARAQGNYCSVNAIAEDVPIALVRACGHIACCNTSMVLHQLTHGLGDLDVEAGEAAVVITISSKLSGTYQSAMIAAEEFDNIYVVDSGTGSVGGGILTELALKYADDGMSAKEIAEKLEEDKKKIIIVALVDTLEYLKRGGRISKTVAFAGTVLNIKPVLSIIDGEINLLGKARGSKHGNNQLVKEMNKVGGVDFSKPVLLGYTGLSDELLLQYIKDSKSLWKGNINDVRYTTIGSVIGTHAGPGAVVVAFFKN